MNNQKIKSVLKLFQTAMKQSIQAITWFVAAFEPFILLHDGLLVFAIVIFGILYMSICIYVWFENVLYSKLGFGEHSETLSIGLDLARDCGVTYRQWNFASNSPISHFYTRTIPLFQNCDSGSGSGNWKSETVKKNQSLKFSKVEEHLRHLSFHVYFLSNGGSHHTKNAFTESDDTLGDQRTMSIDTIVPPSVAIAADCPGCISWFSHQSLFQFCATIFTSPYFFCKKPHCNGWFVSFSFVGIINHSKKMNRKIKSEIIKIIPDKWTR